MITKEEEELLRASMQEKRKSELVKITNHRKAQIAERGRIVDEQTETLPPLRKATGEARLHEEAVLAQYKQAQEATRIAYGNELEAATTFDYQLTRIDGDLIKTRPAVIDEFIREWEDEFARLGNQILPRSITRSMLGKYTPGGESIMESVSNSNSIGRRKVALRRAIEKARYEIPLIAASEAEARQMLRELYNSVSPVEPPQFPDDVRRK
jgi:hypothetical protein